jgi:hypothetical protein
MASQARDAQPTKTHYIPGLLLGSILVFFGVARPASAQEQAVTDALGGNYASLLPEQKKLVDDWFNRLGGKLGKPLDPAEGYEQTPVSVRTTFSAVTHALLRTRLTDKSGKKMAESAAAVIDKVDNVAGEILGASGDRQFRLYVETKRSILDVLRRSREFQQHWDNTIYHRGYPICFRSRGGVPSIQISLTRDLSRADIDVDYRSSRFPISLVNGHLTSSNSDVRAGDNYARHNRQWAGLQNWWLNLLGLPLPEKTKANARLAIPPEPRRKEANPADAVFDFLNEWLVKGQPSESISYFAEPAYSCMDLESAPAKRPAMQLILLQRMKSVNARVGKVATLSDVSIGVPLIGERIKEIPQPYESEFVLYDVREDLAEEFSCEGPSDSAQAQVSAKSEEFGKYAGAAFRLQAQGQTGRTVATLWTKVHDYWKMVAYKVDPALDQNPLPDAGPDIAEAGAPGEFVVRASMGSSVRCGNVWLTACR